MTPHVLALVLFAVGVVLAVIELATSKLGSLVGWALLVLAVGGIVLAGGWH